MSGPAGSPPDPGLLAAPRTRPQDRAARRRAGLASRSVTIHAPTALSTPALRGALIRLLDISAGRLAVLVDSLHPAAWDIEGRVAGGVVTVAELVHVPLHHSRRDLAGRRAGGRVVVPFDRRRRKTAAQPALIRTQQ